MNDRKPTTYIKLLVPVQEALLVHTLPSGPALVQLKPGARVMLPKRLTKRQWLANWYVLLVTQDAERRLSEPQQIVALGVTGGACGRRTLPLAFEATRAALHVGEVQ